MLDASSVSEGVGAVNLAALDELASSRERKTFLDNLVVLAGVPAGLRRPRPPGSRPPEASP